jgi:hypothetical protein
MDQRLKLAVRMVERRAVYGVGGLELEQFEVAPGQIAAVRARR